MDAIRLDEHDFDLARALDDVEAGATMEITRDGRLIATLAPVSPTPGESAKPAPHSSWKEAGVDWEKIRRFRESLPYDPTNSVVAMRAEDRYRPRTATLRYSFLCSFPRCSANSPKNRFSAQARSSLSYSAWTEAEIASALARKQRSRQIGADERSRGLALWGDLSRA